MGAYENPPIINIPNFAQLFTTNFTNLYKIGEARREKEAAAELKKQQDIAKVEQDVKKERKKAFDETQEDKKKASEFAAGTTLDNVGSAMNSGIDFIYKTKDDYAQGKTSFEDYTTNLNKGNAFVNELTDVTKSFNSFYEKVKSKQNLSRFQPEATKDVIGVLASIENNDGDVAFDKDFTNIRLQYKIGGETHEVNMRSLKDPNAYIFNEIFDASETTEAVSKLIQAQKTKSISAIKTDASTTEVTQDVWNKGFETPEARIDKAYNSKLIQGLNENELGSYYQDTVVNSRGKDYDPKNDMELMEATKNLSDEARKTIFELVKEKHFSRENITDGKNTVNAGDILLDYAKRKLAKESVEEINASEAPTQVKTTKDMTSPSATEQKQERLKKFQERFNVTGGISEDFWRNKVSFTSNDRSLENFSKEIRNYGLEVTSTLLNFEETGEIGFKIKGTDSNFKIYKNDSVDDVNRVLADALGIDTSTPPLPIFVQ